MDESIVYLVSLVDKLVSTRDELQSVDMVEFCRYLIPKEPSRTAWRNSPSFNIFRITPDQVAKGTFMRDFLSTSNNTDLINSADLWAQTTMNAKNLAINNCGKDEEIKDLAARLPDGSVAIFLLALLIEAINLSNLSRFVITTDESNLVGIP